MKPLLTVTALLVPFMAIARPADDAGIERKIAPIVQSNKPADRRDDFKNYSPTAPRNDDRRDDRNDTRTNDRFDPRTNDRVDNRRPAPMPAPAPAVRYDHADRMINAAYREVLLRDADAAGLRNYRARIMNEGWTQDRVRAALRDSSEFRGTVVNTIITRAYRDILGRAPDAAGLENYRYKMIARGMSEEGLRNVLLDSPEYRSRLVVIAANEPPRRESPDRAGGDRVGYLR